MTKSEKDNRGPLKTDGFEYDVFLSYSTKNETVVQALAQRLKQDGLRVWLDKWAIKPGDMIGLKIQRGLEQSRTLVMCMSKAYFDSAWTTLEHQTLLFRDPTNEQRRFIPLLIEDCTPPDVIAQFARIDWRRTSEEEYKRLVIACKGDTAEIGEPASDRDPSATVSPNNFAEAKVRRNKNFVGRREILDDLHARLQEGDVALTHNLHGAGAQALRGEGGIGKTQIAVEYAYLHADDYEGRWWIDASKEAIDASTASLATTLGDSPGPQDTPEMICATIRKALSGGEHLLILDNVDDPKAVEALLIPPPARVLITTRLGTLPEAFVSELPVSILEDHDAVALLRKHRSDLVGDEHEEPLGLVAAHLGFHSLAVALAASYLWKHKSTSAEDLLHRLQRADVGDKAHLLANLDPAEHTAGYKLNVAQSLVLHLPDFEDTPAMAVLRLASFCHPDKIPVDVFFKIMKLPKEEEENWLVKLDEVSIIHYEGQTISLHRLMQDVIRERMVEDATRSTLTALVGFLHTRFEHPQDYRNWSMQDAYTAHAEAALEYADHIGEIPGAGVLGNQLGVYLRNRARFDSSLSTLRVAERMDRKTFGENHPILAIRISNIGIVLKAKGDLDGALEHYQKAERIARATYGDSAPQVAVCVNNIGSVLQDKGDLDGAIKFLREAERIDRAVFGDDDTHVAIRVNNIGMVLLAKGDHDRALKCFLEAERIDRAASGDNDPSVARRVNNIGSVLKAKGEFDEALRRFLEAERIDRAAYGDEHPNVATRVNNIGAVLEAKGDIAGARAKCTEGFGIFLAAAGPRALDTIVSAENLTNLDVDPIPLAREIAGDEAADQLEEALRNQPSE